MGSLKRKTKKKMDSKISNNTYGGVGRPTSRVLAPPGGISNVTFGAPQEQTNKQPAAEPGINEVKSTTILPQESGETMAVNKNLTDKDAEEKPKTNDRHVNTWKQNKQRMHASQITF